MCTMKKISLAGMRGTSRGKGKFALVDDEDYEYLMQWTWHWVPRKNNDGYAVRTTTVKGKSVTHYMHRDIMKTPKGMETDHRKGSTLNNQKYNLRIATTTQNSWNSGRRRKGTSKYKGVYKGYRKWYARIRIDGQNI